MKSRRAKITLSAIGAGSKERLKAMAMTNRYVAAYYPKTKWLIEKLPWKSGLATNMVSPTFEQVADPDMP